MPNGKPSMKVVCPCLVAQSKSMARRDRRFRVAFRAGAVCAQLGPPALSKIACEKGCVVHSSQDESISGKPGWAMLPAQMTKITSNNEISTCEKSCCVADVNPAWGKQVGPSPLATAKPALGKQVGLVPPTFAGVLYRDG